MCNCKKNRNQPTPQPQPEPQVIQLPEVDHFNNIDTIEPIDNGKGITGEDRES
jgi:hypothetical protein